MILVPVHFMPSFGLYWGRNPATQNSQDWLKTCRIILWVLEGPRESHHLHSSQPKCALRGGAPRSQSEAPDYSRYPHHRSSAGRHNSHATLSLQRCNGTGYMSWSSPILRGSHPTHLSISKDYCSDCSSSRNSHKISTFRLKRALLILSFVSYSPVQLLPGTIFR